LVCYARPASLLVAVVAVAWIVFAGPVSHFFSTAAVMAAVLTATAVAATAAALAFAAFMSVRHRRAAAGGCVNCRFRCQHAMTGDQGPGGRPGSWPARSAPVLLPVPEAGAPAPRWPDRPVYRTGAAPQRERAAVLVMSSATAPGSSAIGT
jgi:hypothetical protein